MMHPKVRFTGNSNVFLVGLSMSKEFSGIIIYLGLPCGFLGLECP